MNQEVLAGIRKQNRFFGDFPCLAEKKLVDQCYESTGFNRNACCTAIENYKTCKKFWGNVEKVRRRAGISPAQPDAEERAKIKAYYKEHHKLPEYTPTR